MNLYSNIAAALGVELGQEFCISGIRFGSTRYVITEDGFDTVSECKDHEEMMDAWDALLSGEEVPLPCEDETIFACPYCGFLSKDRLEVVECENTHIKIQEMEWQAEYVHGERYPIAINVLNEFGEAIQYRQRKGRVPALKS